MDSGKFGKEFLGTGLSFPFQVDSLSGRVGMTSYEDNIRQSVYLILMTRPGERVMRPDFGCRLHDFAFGTTDYTSLSRMENAVREALKKWEPRIINVEAQVTVDNGMEGRLLIEIRYVVRSTNNPYNLVFPFYINEGAGTE